MQEMNTSSIVIFFLVIAKILFFLCGFAEISMRMYNEGKFIY